METYGFVKSGSDGELVVIIPGIYPIPPEGEYVMIEWAKQYEVSPLGDVRLGGRKEADERVAPKLDELIASHNMLVMRVCSGGG